VHLSSTSLLLLVIASSSLAREVPSGYYSVPPASAPELAARGRYPVGVRTIEIVHRDQIDILHFDKTTGKAPLYDRPLTVEVWYPAVIPPGQTEETTYQMPVPGGHGFEGVNVQRRSSSRFTAESFYPSCLPAFPGTASGETLRPAPAFALLLSCACQVLQIGMGQTGPLKPEWVQGEGGV
jgi:hypothetical protein